MALPEPRAFDTVTFYANRPLNKARADPVFFATQARSYAALGLEVEIVAPSWRVPGGIAFTEAHEYFRLPPEVRVRHVGPSLPETSPAKLLRLTLALTAFGGRPPGDRTLHHHKDPLAAILAARRPGIHVLEVVEEPRSALDRRALSAVDGLIAISPLLGERLVELAPSLARRVLAVRGTFDPSLAPWGDVDRDEARSGYGISTGARVVAYSGKIFPGSTELRLIAEACGGLGVTLLVAGGDEETRRWLAEVAPADVALVAVGHMPPADLARFYAAADALVSYYPSDHATLAYIDPGKIYPYLGSGRPVVAAAHASLLDLLAHGRNAELAAPDDADALRRSLARVLDDPAYAGRLAAAGRDTAEAHTIDRRSARILEFAAGLARAHAASAAPR